MSNTQTGEQPSTDVEVIETAETPSEVTPSPSPSPTPQTPDPEDTRSIDEILEGITDPEEMDRALAAIESGKPIPKTDKNPKPPADPAPETPKNPDTIDPDLDEDSPDRGLLANRPRLTFLEENEKRLVNSALQMVRVNRENGGKLTISEALAQLVQKPDQPSAPPVAPVSETPSETPETTDSPLQAYESAITSKQSEISSLEAQIDDPANEFDVAKISKLSAKLAKANTELAILEDRKSQAEDRLAYEQEQEALQQQNAAYNSARERAIELLPDSNTVGHPDWLAVKETRERLEKTNPAFFDNPEYPFYLAAIVKASRSASPAVVPTPQPSPKPEAAPRRASRPLAPVAGGDATTDHPMSADDLLRQVEAITDPDEIERLADAVGTKAPR